MKTLYLKIFYILVTAILFFFVLPHTKSIQADETNNIEIINVQTQPSIIKVGDKFTINATLVNNSPSTIYVEAGGCAGPFSVIFANHTRINHTYEGCTLVEIIHKLDPGEKAIETSSDSNDVYMATSAGTVNA